MSNQQLLAVYIRLKIRGPAAALLPSCIVMTARGVSTVADCGGSVSGAAISPPPT